jgi:hypothetical protein
MFLTSGVKYSTARYMILLDASKENGVV